MRLTHAFALTVLASVTIESGTATASDTVYLTPPLFREQARETQHVRSQSDLTTTPQPVAAAKSIVAPRTVQEDGDVQATGSF